MYEAAAATWLARAELDERQGRPPRAPLESALATVDRALTADPDDAIAYTTKAYVLLRRHRSRVDGNADQRPLLDQLAAAAERAVSIDARDVAAWDALGNAHVYRGSYEMYHGGKGEPWLAPRARRVCARARAAAERSVGQQRRRHGAPRLGTALDDGGGDPMPEYRAAMQSYEHATAIDPQYLFAWTNYTDVAGEIAAREVAAGLDPRATVESATRAGERGLAIDPKFYLLLDNLAGVQLALANYLVDHGDPAAALATARGYLDRANAIKPGHATGWYYRAMAARHEARAALAHGRDASKAIAGARAALDQAQKLAPASAEAWVERARLDLVDAQARHGDAALLARARADADKAIALDGQYADAKLTAALACLEQAKQQRSAEAARRGLTYVDAAIAINPKLAGARSVREALALQLRR